MQQLIERIEKSRGPDRNLDAEIFRAIGAPLPAKFCTAAITLEWDDKDRCFVAPLPDGMRVRYEHPAYTESLDAAMTLVRAAHEFEIGSAHLLECYWAAVISSGGEHKAKGKTPAAALSAAALKSR